MAAQSFTYNDLTNLYGTKGSKNTTQPVPGATPQPFDPTNTSMDYGQGPYSGGPQSPFPTAAPAASTASGGAMSAGMDPALAAIYQKGGLTPGGAGTGFADWQYWQDKPSQWNRLASDIAGTGTDQPTGTPGQGAWSSSGRGQAGAPGAAGAFGGSSGASGSWTGVPGGAATDIFNTLMKRANQGLTIDPSTDPVMRQQQDAFNAQRQLGDRRTLAALAEKGGPQANLSAETRAAGEASGQAGAQFQGQMMQNELNARRQEIQQALSGAAGLLTQEQAMQLQQEMAALDRAQQESQFGRSLGQGAYQYDTSRQDKLGGF
jgi:hypothetical protein